MAKKDAYSLVVPLDASGMEGYETGPTLQVMVVDARGTHHSEKVKLGAKGAGSASFDFGQTPGSLRVLVGPEDASAEELLGLQTLSLEVSLNQWADKRELTLAPIRFPPYIWETLIRNRYWRRTTLSYVVESRSIESNGNTRPFVLARPEYGGTEDLPLVIVLHADDSTGADIRAKLPIESHLNAVYAYPDAPGGTFNYDTVDGRETEAQFVQDLIAALHAWFKIKTSRVFVAGMSGGAAMANALGCYLGPTVIRGLGIHSGTLYPKDNDFEVNQLTGVVNRDLPDVRFVWGKEDPGPYTAYDPDGLDTCNKYVKTQGCAGTTTLVSPDPCVDPYYDCTFVAYKGCTRAVEWFGIGGLAHDYWPGAAGAFATFFAGLS